jgi:type III restriction enzyme
MILRKVQYQEETLRVLREFLSDARIHGPAESFARHTTHLPTALRRAYMTYGENLADAPTVCLRLPTGGGKTLVAAQSISIAGREFLDQEFPLVLWLVPTTIIREQTYAALTMPGDIHCEVLKTQYGDRVKVIKASDFVELRPQDLGSRTTIVIGTLATARVDQTELRRVYAHNEEMEPFFSQIPSGVELERDTTQTGNPVKSSFINLLAMCRPLVIVDEAHNNRSPLSLEVMRRIRPSCIIEFTATPAEDSNILHHVSASELFAEHMIKLPIELTQHPTWQETIHYAVQERAKLAELAKGETDYVRPIVLIQAENIDKDVTWQKVLDYLQNDEGIERERIAVATGTEKELDQVDLFSRSCPIEFVITVKALKEGWDCSFAYVFCSVATVHSKTEVEQILGRVLRMPYASRRKVDALNRAYAHVSSVSWPAAVSQLYDRLVSMGFDETEAENAILMQRPSLPLQTDIRYRDGDDTAGLPLSDLTVREKPDLSGLDKDEQRYVTVMEHKEGLITLHVDADIPEATLRKVERHLPASERKALRQTVAIRRRQRERESAPARRGLSFVVPQMVVRVQDEFELLESDNLLGVEGWHLTDYSPALSPDEFTQETELRRYELSIEGRRVTQRFLGAQMTLDLRHMDDTWDERRLVNWLDGKLQDPLTRPHPDIRQPVMRSFVHKAVSHLIKERKLTLGELQLHCFALLKALERKINGHRQTAHKKGFQRILALSGEDIKTDYTYPFEFSANTYCPNEKYSGSRRFNKHYFPDIGKLKSEGEEFDCAVAIDECPAVEFWARNLEHGHTCFRLPRSTGYFYPDFVAKLQDGRILVIEYKGEHLEDKASEQEKRAIGELYEKNSAGKALFLWAVKQDSAGRNVARQLQTKIGYS